MNDLFLRTNGQIYGPYSQQQLTSMIAAGRLAPTAEVSRDRVHWMPASSLQSGADTGPRGGVASPPRRTSVSYLASLRGRTNYPIYRAVVFIFTRLTVVFCVKGVIRHRQKKDTFNKCNNARDESPTENKVDDPEHSISKIKMMDTQATN